MTTPTTAPVSAPKRRHGTRWLHWFLVMMVASLVVVAVEAASMFRLGDEARELRFAVKEVAAWDAQTKIQFTAGPAIIGLAQFVTGFIDDVPPEARRALAAVSHASVGVYQLNHEPSEGERVAMMNESAERMMGRGWHRMVAVNEGDTTVMVYAPDAWNGSDEINLCVAVCDGTELVVVSAKSRVERLRELVEMHTADFRDHLEIEFRSKPSVRL